VDVEGLDLKVASAPNFYEKLSPLSGFYEDLETDMASGGNQGGASEAFETLLDQPQNAQLKQLWEQDRAVNDRQSRINLLLGLRNEVVQRFVPDLNEGKRFDILLTHKGPHKLAESVEDGRDKKIGSGIGLEEVVRVVKPTIILGGHIHRKLSTEYELSPGHTVAEVRSSPETFFVHKINTRTKRIVRQQEYDIETDGEYSMAA